MFYFLPIVTCVQIAPLRFSKQKQCTLFMFLLFMCLCSFLWWEKMKDECLKGRELETVSPFALRAQQEGCQVLVVRALILCVCVWFHLFTRPLLFEHCCLSSPVILRVYFIAFVNTTTSWVCLYVGTNIFAQVFVSHYRHPKGLLLCLYICKGFSFTISGAPYLPKQPRI